MTFLSKSTNPLRNSFSVESIASAFNLCCPIVLRVNVLILFNVEKLLSDSAVVTGVVIMILVVTLFQIRHPEGCFNGLTEAETVHFPCALSTKF